MMKRKFVRRLIVAFGTLFMFNGAVAVPRWTAATEQVGDGESKQATQAPDLMTDRSKAADLLNSTPSSTAGVLDALVTESIPAPKSFLEAVKDPNLQLQSSFASIWHNFADGVLSEKSTPGERLAAMIGAAKEYLWKDRADWKYLDPKMPNAKFLSEDGKSEFIYNIYTRDRVKTGINAGTSNQYGLDNLGDKLLHIIRDAIIRYPEQGNSSDVDQKIAQYLVSHPEMRKEFMRRAEELAWPNFLKQIWNEVEKLFVSTAGEENELSQLKNLGGKESKGNDVADKSQRPDLHNLNLDDPNGDWCKCESPGCVEHVGRDSCGKVQGYVTIQCSKCGKINVEYARKALSFESQAESQGVDTTWTGNRSDAVKAAQGK